MKLNKKYSYWVILLFLVISTTSSTAKTTDETEEWKVKVGDSRTYTLSKYIDLKDIDGNGDPESKIYLVIKEDGTWENVTLKKGTKYTINITALDHSATIQMIFGDIVSSKRSTGYDQFIRKTIDNKSYWEREAFGLNNNPIDDTNYSVEGNYYVEKTFNSDLNGNNLESISKRDWKTGWLSYAYTKTTNDTHTIHEQELTSSFSSITGFEITMVFVGLTIIAIVVSRKRQQTKK